jgi:hypothetical protein
MNILRVDFMIVKSEIVQGINLEFYYNLRQRDGD